MNDDTIKELLLNNQENFKKVFAILETVVSGLSNLESRVAALEAKDAITRPLWQEIRADQQRILDRMDGIEARMDSIEAHLKQQDEKMTESFRKLEDKFDHLALDYYDLHADVRDLKRRVTRLEPVN